MTFVSQFKFVTIMHFLFRNILLVGRGMPLFMELHVISLKIEEMAVMLVKDHKLNIVGLLEDFQFCRDGYWRMKQVLVMLNSPDEASLSYTQFANGRHLLILLLPYTGSWWNALHYTYNLFQIASLVVKADDSGTNKKVNGNDV